ncbi:hypothetical protein D3C76_816210 [compost metagenome]
MENLLLDITVTRFCFSIISNLVRNLTINKYSAVCLCLIFNTVGRIYIIVKFQIKTI